MIINAEGRPPMDYIKGFCNECKSPMFVFFQLLYLKNGSKQLPVNNLVRYFPAKLRTDKSRKKK